MSAQDEVAAAADALVGAFGAHDPQGYFAAFDPAATFMFYTTDRLLGSRAEWEAEWAELEATGFHVDGCTTADRRIDVISADVAVLTHTVRTRIAGEPAEVRERETIVFRRCSDGRWLAIHEHLSPDPNPAEELT
jgi:ketosteroid isomerase-like protein